ncbi:chaps-domain-containing protein [Apiospora sp. TS-2023a]
MPSPAVPEISEEVLHESIEARTESLQSLRELGPPICLAAYINTLTYNNKDHGQPTPNKIVEGLYSCYNAFSRLDMRVHVTIPGTVDSYCIDERGEKRPATDELWLETYLCSVLRAYSYADDGSGDTIRKIMGVRRFNPVMNTETEHRFLSAAEHLFFRGWQLGSDSVVQVPNNVSNHLTSGLLKYFHTTGRFASAINLFEKLRSQNVEVSSLLAKVLIMGNEEVQGVRVLYQALKDTPMDYVMLDTQADFLMKKALSAPNAQQKEERLKMAQGCADRSTIAAPSEFGTWARLAQVYVTMEDWENALTILNSCPMFTYQDKDAPLMPEPKDVYLPTLPETRLEEIDSEPESRYNEQVDPSLLNLRAAAYRGTFKQAYSILTEMTAKIGWDQLLKIRSNVFVMEDEYRTERQDTSSLAPPQRNASLDGLRGTPEPPTNGDEENEKENTKESDKESDKDDDDKSSIEGDEKDEKEDDDEEKSKSGDADSTAPTLTNGKDVPNSVEKPEHTIDPGKVKADAIKSDSDNSATTEEHLSRLNNKRLCERWLDSLFMVLYEDLRVYTIWRTQMAQYRAQSMQYKKSAEEWEILGCLAERLQHHDEAAEAYRACLAQRFSPKALSGILRVYEKTKNTREIVASLIRLVTWQYRWYSEFSPDLLYTIRTLIEDEGAVKVRSIIQATSLPQNVLDLTHHYAALCHSFRSTGTDG